MMNEKNALGEFEKDDIAKEMGGMRFRDLWDSNLAMITKTA